MKITTDLLKARGHIVAVVSKIINISDIITL